jgi:hypothetical protein
MEDRTEGLKQEYKRWLRRYSWAWFGTLKITSGMPSKRRANQMFERWISELRRTEGAEDFRWVRVLEKGGSGQNLHFHVLVGGLRNRRKHWEAEWIQLGGEALIGKFDPAKEAILYMTKEMNDSGNLDIDFCLPNRKQSVPPVEPRRRIENEITVQVEEIPRTKKTIKVCVEEAHRNEKMIYLRVEKADSLHAPRSTQRCKRKGN